MRRRRCSLCQIILTTCLLLNFWIEITFLIFHRIHRIHRRQHAFTDDTGMSKHRLPPYNAYYHNWQTLNFTASDSSSDDRCFLKVLILLQLMQLAGSKFQLSITLFENAYFLTFSLNLFLNSLWSCPLLSSSSSWKNNCELISYFLLTILKVSIRSHFQPVIIIKILHTSN